MVALELSSADKRAYDLEKIKCTVTVQLLFERL